MTNCRREKASEESYNLDPEANMQLLLEPVAPDALEYAHDGHDGGDASTQINAQLNRALSLQITSPSSSFAERNAGASIVFRKIGGGACGAILAQDGKPTVIKLAKSPTGELWNDFVMHNLIAETFENCGITQIEIPKCQGFIPRNHQQFWDNNPDLTNAAKDICNLPAHALCAERILPLPKPTRTLLIEKFCPSKVKTEAFNAASNNDCLVRVYLGSLNGRSINRFFNLRNLKLYLNHMIDLKMAVAGMASDMATALAAMHWAAKTDARDVEFVLGSSTKPLSGITTSEIAALPPNSLVGPQSGNLEDFHHRRTALWLLDFNQVRRITMDEAGVAMAVEAFLLNDPYYPRPFQQSPVAKALWNIFVQTYLEESSGHLREESGDVRKLPGLFLSGVIEAERKKRVDSA